MTILLLYFLTGSIAGLLSGLYGIGGGMVIVPLLSHILAKAGYHESIIMHVAASTSLCIMVFTTQASVRAHHRYEKLDPLLCRRLFPGIALGAVGGVLLSDGLPTPVLQALFGIFLIFVAMRLFFVIKLKVGAKPPGPWISFAATVFIGFTSGMLGVGGGVLMIPFLSQYHISMRKAIGLAAFSSLVLAVVGASVSILTGYNEASLPKWHTGYINWLAVLCVATTSILFVPFGVWLSHRLPLHLLKRCFAVVILFVGVHMLWR